MTIDWTTAAAIVTVLAGLGAVMIWAMDARLDRRLSGFLESIGGVYMRKDVADERHADHGRRIENLERVTSARSGD